MSETKARPHGAQEYRGNGNHHWEEVEEGGMGFLTHRLRVPGGWLYRCIARASNHDDVAMTFVPMPQPVGYVI